MFFYYIVLVLVVFGEIVGIKEIFSVCIGWFLNNLVLMLFWMIGGSFLNNIGF